MAFKFNEQKLQCRTEKLELLFSCSSALSEEDRDGGSRLLNSCNILEDGSLRKKLHMSEGREQHLSVSFSK